MEGLIEEGKEVLEEDGSSAVIDAALIGAAQRVEHYEMAAYGTVRAMCISLGHSKAAKLLQQTLDEEKAADEKLTSIADESVNREAAGSAHPDAEEAEEDEDEAPAAKKRAKPAAAKKAPAKAVARRR
jgi:ferritin-like metal-binding protein YciE